MNAFTIHGETVHLSHEGAVFLPAHRTLIVADVHLGKSATFRARGLAIPEGDTRRDLRRIAELVAQTGAQQLVVAGDFFHAPAGVTPELEQAIEQFIDQVAIPFHLVSGNHDAKLKRLPCSLAAIDSLELGNIRIVHDPKDSREDSFHLAGHWHPAVKIRDSARASLRFRCFLLRGHTLVLPAFGSFTGGAVIPLDQTDRVFVPMKQNVVELPAALVR